MAPKAANTSSAAKPAGSSAEKSGALGDVTNQRKLLPLSHLNAQSARVGLWEVMIWKPKDTMHSYLWEGNKETPHGFQCTLISTQDPSQYILADSHGQGMTEQKTKVLLEMFKPGRVFTMNTMVLAANSKRMYFSYM